MSGMLDGNHVMIDIETLDNVSTAAVASIGAVLFNPVDGVLDEFHTRINPRTAQAAGCTVGADTVLWWLRQAPEAQEELHGKEPLGEALQAFRDFCLGRKLKHVWGNAPSFDCSILRHSYERVGITTPWRFYQERCYRTIKNMWPEAAEREGVYHNALDDARYQTAHLLSVMDALGFNGDEEE